MSHTKYSAETNPRISIHSVWTHRILGGEFRVIGIAIGAGKLNGESIIIFQDKRKASIFVQEEDDWNATMEKII